MTRLSGWTLDGFLEGIASTEPSPGAGATGAMALAMGIACARKAIRISALHAAQPDFAAADTLLQALAEAAVAGADRDAEGFERLIHALQQAHDTDVLARERHAAIHAAAAALVRVAEELIQIGDAVRLMLQDLRDRLDPMMINDINAALTLIESNRRIQTDNATENRRHLG